MESTEESSWLAAVDREETTNGESTTSPVNGRFTPAFTASGGVVFLLEGVVLTSISFGVRGFFDGADEGARPS